MEPGHELSSANHDHHPLEWRSSDACLLCLLTTIQDGSASGGPALTIHRRFALSFLIQRLGIDAGVVASPKQLAAHSSLIQLLQRSHHVTAKVLIGLLSKLVGRIYLKHDLICYFLSLSQLKLQRFIGSVCL